ncbi:MAG: SPASM domain-containing protein [archaeon]
MTRRPCAALWKTPVIHRNGDVTVCCRDVLMELKLGNIRESTLEQIWLGDRITAMRINAIKGDYAEMPKCCGCDNLDNPTISDEEITQYLKSINRQDLIKPFLARMH